MNKICTSIEQSKKLIELGIDVKTADMYWLNRHIDLTQTKYELFVVDRSDKHIDFFNSYAVAIDNNEIIPAWSVTALLNAITIEHNLHGYLTENGKVYRVETLYAGNSKSYDNPVDACYELIIKIHNGETRSN